MLAAFMTQFPLSRPPINQTLFNAIADVTPEPSLLAEVEIVLGGMKVDSAHRPVNQ